MIAAYGCATHTNYVAFESTYKELTEMISVDLPYSGEIRVVQPQNYAPHYRINFSSEKLASSLHAYGIIPGRTFSGVTYFPNSQYLASYVLGYFDGDGCAYANKGRSGGLVCIVGSFEFACELARHLGMGSVQEHQFKKVYYWRRPFMKSFPFLFAGSKKGLQINYCNPYLIMKISFNYCLLVNNADISEADKTVPYMRN